MPTTVSDETKAAVESALDKITAMPSEAEEKDDGLEDSKTREEESVEDKEAADVAGTDGSADSGGGSESGDETDRGADAEDGGGSGEEQVSVVSDTALEEAIRAGIPIRVARDCKSDNELRDLAEYYQTIRQQRSTIATQETAKVDGAAASAEEDLLAEFPEINEDSYDPALVKAFEIFKKAVKRQADLTKSVRESQEALTRDTQAAKNREIETWFDASVASLDDDCKRFLGTGPFGKLTPGSKEFQRREEVARQIGVLNAGYTSCGLPVPPRDVLFDTAVAMVLANDLQNSKEDKLRTNLQKRSKMHIQRPGGTKEKPQLSPLDEAVAKIREKYPNLR
jgi:hypothetical protein